jgi:hypothetical protein
MATQTTIGPLASSTPFYWRVLGRSEFATGTWSDTAVFVTNAPPDRGLITQTPLVAAVDVPVNGSVTYSTSSIYSSYRVEFSKSPTFDPLVSSFVSSTGTCDYRDLERETTYFWRVRGTRTGAPADVGPAAFFTTLRNDVVSVDEAAAPSPRVYRQGTSLRVEGITQEGDVSVRVVDLQGRVLGSSSSTNSGTVTIDLSHLAARQVVFVLISNLSGASSSSAVLW